MSYISVIVIYLCNGAENGCISLDFVFFLECTLVHVFLFFQCLTRWIEAGCMADCFFVNTLMMPKNL
jgi:hypothetical protein